MLEPDSGLVISPGDALAAVFQRQLDGRLRQELPAAARQGVTVSGGDLPVLAVFTVEVAAQSAQGKAKRTGVEVEEGLLFYRVGGHGGDAPVVQIMESAVMVPVHAADAGLLRINKTAPLAGATPHPGTRKLLIKQRLTHTSPPMRLL